MRYRICQSSTIEALQQEVDRLSHAGWQPVGDMTVMELPDGRWYAQAVAQAGQRAGEPQDESNSD